MVLGVIASVICALTGCSTSNDPADAYKGESQQKIYADGKDYLKDRSYVEASKRFEALDVQYPFGKETEKAQLYLIYAYYMKEDYPLAVAAADRYIRIHPTSPHVDYAYYLRGLSNYYQNLGLIERFFSISLSSRDLSQLKKSYESFSELTSRFPNSRYAPAAHQYMVYLRNVMAKYELNIAQYYYDRKAYVASANRASMVVAHYQGSPYVIDALKMMANSYKQLGLVKEYDDTVKVMQFNGIKMT